MHGKMPVRNIPMHPVGLIRSVALRPVMAFLEEIGAPVRRLVTSVGLSTSVLDDPEGLVPMSSISRVLEQAAQAEGVENLGIVCGQRARIDTLGVYGRLICSRPTLGDALETAVSNLSSYTSNVRMWLASHGAHARLCSEFVDGLVEGRQQTDHYSLMVMLGAVRLAAGAAWRPTEVQVQTGESAALRDAEPLSDAKITFMQPATAITFPRVLLRAPLPRPVNGVSDRCLGEWEASAPARNFSGSITQVIEMLARESYPNIGLMANILGMSVRSLQRHLAATGYSYQSLVARTRLATASSLLEETNSKVIDIALDVGYSDHAHFTRAFRRWTGRSPQEFRRMGCASRAISSPLSTSSVGNLPTMAPSYRRGSH
jgi:AraC-like DNA-binding protein